MRSMGEVYDSLNTAMVGEGKCMIVSTLMVGEVYDSLNIDDREVCGSLNTDGRGGVR